MLSIFADAIFVATRTDAFRDHPRAVAEETTRALMPRLAMPLDQPAIAD